jgi:hypothetical protein
LAAYFVALRTARKMSQAQAGQRGEPLGLTYQAIRGLEKGETRHISPSQLRAMATLYRADYAQIVSAVTRHVYGAKLGPSEVDSTALSLLETQLQVERERRVAAEAQLAVIESTFIDAREREDHTESAGTGTAEGGPSRNEDVTTAGGDKAVGEPIQRLIDRVSKVASSLLMYLKEAERAIALEPNSPNPNKRPGPRQSA